MNWRFWTWRRRKKAVTPCIVVEVVSDEHYTIRCDWPDVTSLPPEEAESLAKAIAGVAFMLCDGQMVSQIQQAVAVRGHLKGEPAMSNYILDLLNRLREAKQGRAGQRGGALVRPDEVFSPRQD